MRLIPGTSRTGLPGWVPECGSNGMRAIWGHFDLPGGECTFVVPPASHRSWVRSWRVDAAIELTVSSSKRAPGASMGDFASQLKGRAVRALPSHAQDSQGIVLLAALQ